MPIKLKYLILRQGQPCFCMFEAYFEHKFLKMMIMFSGGSFDDQAVENIKNTIIVILAILEKEFFWRFF